jgi:hypothetical protein
LRNYTGPSLRAVSDAFALSAAHPEPSKEPELVSNRPVTYIHDDYLEDLFSDVFPDLYTDQDVGTIDSTPVPVSFPWPLPIPSRVEALLSLLTNQYNLNPRAFAFPTNRFPVEVVRAVFTSNNIVQYLTAFFAYFHPHTPFIHRPSFNIETVFLPLLLAMSLLGSVFAAPQDDALSARYFFDLGEQHVFGLLHQMTIADSYSNDERIQLLQAAVLMHAIQMASNNDGIRLRIRTHRFRRSLLR